MKKLIQATYFLRSLFFHPIMMRYVYLNHLQGRIPAWFSFALFPFTSPRVYVRGIIWGRNRKIWKKIVFYSLFFKFNFIK